MKPIALQLYSIRELAKQDFAGALAQVAEMGYVAVEPAGLHGHSPPEVRKMVDGLGLRVSSMHARVPDAATLAETVDTAKALGCDLVIAGAGADNWTTLDGVKGVAETFQAAAELLRPHGLRMGYHNHWWEMDELDGQLALERFLEMAPDVFSETDCYWAANFGAVDVPALISRNASRIPVLHVKDGPLVRGEPHTAVGAGKMDIPACIGAADEGVLAWLVVELDHCATDMLTAVRDSCAYLTSSGLGEGRR